MRKSLEIAIEVFTKVLPWREDFKFDEGSASREGRVSVLKQFVLHREEIHRVPSQLVEK